MDARPAELQGLHPSYDFRPIPAGASPGIASAMENRRALALAVAMAAAAPPAGAFCVENAVAGYIARASLVPLQRKPPRVYAAAVEHERQSCCNPRNGECNPDGMADDGVVFFRARLEAARAGARPAVCGATPDPRESPHVYAPVRGFVRFEANPLFNPARATTLVNPPMVARVLDDERRLLTTFPCL